MKMLRIYVLTLVLALAVFGNVKSKAADIPPEILEAYSAYNTALTARDYKAAITHAKTAWELSEKLLGDDMTTGDTAYNYGYLELKTGKIENAPAALLRSSNLAMTGRDDGVNLRLKRDNHLVTAYILLDEDILAWNALETALGFADQHKMADNVLSAELIVNQARLVNKTPKVQNKARKNALEQDTKTVRRSIPKGKKSEAFAQDALEIFEKHQDEGAGEYVVDAYKLVGYGHERKKDWLAATLVYQKAMLLQQKTRDLDDPVYARTLGRWLNTRKYVVNPRTNKAEAEAAYAAGICKCWPYTNEHANKAKPIKRTPPKMPRNATISGFSIVKYDLDDEGKLINSEMLYSWPPKMYDKSSMRSLKKWKFESKAEGETGGQREGLVTTINYILSNSRGDQI